MAVVRYGNGMAPYGSPIDQVDLPSLDLVTRTATLASFVDENGAIINFVGTGLTYVQGSIKGGSVTGIEVFAAAGDRLFSITEMTAQAATAYTALLLTGTLGIFALNDDDRIYGSSKGDILAGGAGDDRVFGGGGRDILGTMDGRDRLTGGNGVDTFVFVANQGRDRVMDFADDDLQTDDLIALTPRLYDRMVMTQEGNDVLLEFGTAGSLLILNQTVAEMGIDDFLTSGLPI